MSDPRVVISARQTCPQPSSEIDGGERVAVGVAVDLDLVGHARNGEEQRPLGAHDLAHAMPGPGLHAAAREDEARRRQEQLAGRLHAAGEPAGHGEMTDVRADHAMLRFQDRERAAGERKELLEAVDHFLLTLGFVGRLR